MGNQMVSIVVPVYNVYEYLDRCIQSLLNQTYPSIEVILVDDCSTDRSLEKCREYEKRHANIRLVCHLKNGGQLAGRNSGLEVAFGAWVMFVDSDDALESHVIENMVAIAERENAEIVMAAYETICASEIKTFRAKIPERTYSPAELAQFLFSDMELSVLSCVGSKLYSIPFIKNKKPATPNDIVMNSDIAFILDALSVAERVTYFDTVCYSYYQRESSISYSYRENMFPVINRAREKLRPFLETSGCYKEKEHGYQLSRFWLISVALIQELRFEKGYKSYLEVFNQIMNDFQTNETVNYILTNDYPLKYKAFMWLLVFKWKNVLYFLLYVIYTVKPI